MAWNEPGGNSNNQDPWGGKRRGGDRKGPPDLDEAFRKLQDSLNGLFGGGKKRTGGGGDGSGTSKGGGLGLLGIGLAVLAAIWLYSAVYVVDEQEQAVVLRFGKYYETVGPGLTSTSRRSTASTWKTSRASVRTPSRGRCSPKTRTSSRYR